MSAMTSELSGNLDEILISIQHHEQSIRRAGEMQYHILQGSPDYVTLTTRFASDGTKAVHLRQLVILLLNQQISKDWNSFSQESKGALVQFSLSGCSINVALLRHAAMVTLSKIVSRSSKSECSSIINHLSSQLTVPDVFVVTSTLRCLCTIAEEGRILFSWLYSSRSSQSQHYEKWPQYTNNNISI